MNGTVKRGTLNWHNNNNSAKECRGIELLRIQISTPIHKINLLLYKKSKQNENYIA